MFLATGVLPVRRAGAVTGFRVAQARLGCPAGNVAAGAVSVNVQRTGRGMIVVCCP